MSEQFDNFAAQLKEAKGDERMTILHHMKDIIARYAEEHGYPVPQFILTKEEFLAAAKPEDRARMEEDINNGFHSPAYYENGKVYYFVEGCENFGKDIAETMTHEYAHADNAEFPENVNALTYAVEDTHEVSEDELIEILNRLSNSFRYEDDAAIMEERGKNPHAMLADEVIAHAVARMTIEGEDVLESITTNPTLQAIIKRAYNQRENERQHNLLSGEISERSNSEAQSTETDSRPGNEAGKRGSESQRHGDSVNGKEDAGGAEIGADSDSTEKHSERAEDAAGETETESEAQPKDEGQIDEAEAKPKKPADPDANLRADIRAARDMAKMMFPDANPELLDKIARDLNQQPLTREQRNQMERIAKAFGLRIRWFKTMPQNGTYSKEKGVICIATDSWHQLSDTFGHEMTHALKDVDMDAYNRLKQAVIEASAKNEEERKGLQRAIDLKYSEYDAKDRMEEYVSDTIGAAIASRDMADKILFNLDHKVLGRMRDIVKKMMAAVSDFEFNTENKVRNLLRMDERVRDERVPSALDKLQGAIMDAYRMAQKTELARRAEEKRKAEEEKKKEEERKKDEENGGVKRSERTVTSEMDQAYMDAVNKGDMETAQRMVNEAAERAGYTNDESWKMLHEAPNSKDDFNKSLDDVSEMFPGIYGDKAYRYYGSMGAGSHESIDIIRKFKGNPDALVTIYRAVPKSVKEGKVRNGDWVTLSEDYARDHGISNLDNYRIIKEEVPGKYLYTDGNSVNEFGYDDGSDYVYQNTKNNRKLADTVTYDDNGNVIPLSKRFNPRKSDVRYSKREAWKNPATMSEEEKAERGKQLMNAHAIKVTSNQIVKAEGMSARKVAEKWWLDNVGPKPLHFNTEIGNIDIDKHSIKDSLGHNFSQAKLDSITSLKEGFINAVYLGTLKDSERKNKGKEVQNHYFAYPINYDGERCYVFCRAIEDNNINRIRVHEVFIAKNIKIGGDVLQTVARQPRGNITSYKAILANVLDAANVANNSETAQTSAEENGVREQKRTPTSSELALRDGLVERLREAGLGVSLSEEEGQMVLDLVNGGAREHKVYHGSHADFDHFDHSHMGEGEGVQAYGWGSYVTEVEGIGRSYAKQNTRLNSPILQKYAQKKHRLSLDEQKRDYLIKESMPRYDRIIKEKSEMITDPQYAEDKDFYEMMIEKAKQNKVFTQKLIDDLSRRIDENRDWLEKHPYDEPTKHLYTVEIPDDTGNNYLNWDGSLTDEQIKRILKGLRDIADIDTNEWNADGLKGEARYAYLVAIPEALGFDVDEDDDYEIMKATSEFLSEIGFTGIKYPANYRRGGRKDGAKNYVIFNDEDLEITDHVRFFRGKGGEAYGFTVDGKIYIDPKHVNAETPIHEYAHLWATALQQKDAKAWGDVVRLMKDTGIWDSVRESYPELKTDDEIADEVLATYSGQRGAERLREEMRQVMQGEGRMVDKVDALSAMERVRNAIAKFWRKVAEMLGIRYTKAEDVADHVLGDLLDRVNPNEQIAEDISTDSTLRFHKETDKETLRRLENEPTIKVYRAMQVIDGKLYPPMAAKIGKGLVEPNELGVWIRADENPDLAIPVIDPKTGKQAVEKNGEPRWKFKLDKGGKDATGKDATDVTARYNPYWHTSRSPLNDQFKSAWIRPNLVIVECEVPASELTSGYKAERAKDPVGETPWKSGSVTSQVRAQTGRTRQVILSRWCKPVRVLSDAEVAQKSKEFIGDADVVIPENVLTPNQRVEFEKAGLKIGPPEKRVNKSEQIEEAIRKGLMVDNTVDGSGVKEQKRKTSSSNEYTPEERSKFKGVPISKPEYAKLFHAIHTHNQFKVDRVNGEFTRDYYYLYTHHGDGDFTIEAQIPRDGNEDLIRILNKKVENGTIRDSRDINSAIERDWSRQNHNYRDYASPEGRRAWDSMSGNMAEQDEANRRRGHEQMGEGISGRSSSEIHPADRERRIDDEAGDVVSELVNSINTESFKDVQRILSIFESKDKLEEFWDRVVNKHLKPWDEVNKRALAILHIAIDERKAELEGNAPAEKFSLRDGSFIRSGSYFSGGGLLEEGLKNYLDPRVAVEFNEKIAGVYADNFGRHIVTADVRNVDPRELTAHVDGSVEYFHASPVCKNFSRAKREAGEVELDKETAQSTADFIRANRPRVVTIENVKGYRGSDALKIITDALTEEGYDWDADVYNTGDFGGYTKRERLIVRAVRDGKLPEKPKPLPQSERKGGWMEAVSDLMDSLPEKRSGVPEWMDNRLKAMGIDWRNIDKPLYVLGQGDAADKVSHAFADELLPTLRTKGGDVIIMPDGRVLRATPRVLARVTGLADDYKMPVTDDMAHTIVGNGIPSQLSEHVVGPLLEHVFNGGERITHDMKESRRVSGRLANTGNTSSVAQRIYEEAVRGRAFEIDEAWHDSLVSVKALQDALAKERGVDIRDLENVYLHLVHLSSVSAAEMTEYRNEQVENLLDAMNAILKDKKLTIEDENGKKHRLTEMDIETYLNCKHGLERNEHIARKKAKEEADRHTPPRRVLPSPRHPFVRAGNGARFPASAPCTPA